MPYEEELKLLRQMNDDLEETKEGDDRFYFHKPTRAKLQSVTTYLNALGHPGLDKWKENQLNKAWLTVLQYPKWKNVDNNAINLNNILQDVVDVYEHNTGYGARLGKAVHKYIEYEINYMIDGTLIDVYDDITDEFDMNEIEKESNQFMDWMDQHNYTPLMSEVTVANLNSTPSKYAGTIDIFATDDKENLYIMDVKTGKGVYGQYFYQLAAYRESVWQIICNNTEINKKNIINMIIQVRNGQTLSYSDKNPDQSYKMFNNIVGLKDNITTNNNMLYRTMRALQN